MRIKYPKLGFEKLTEEKSRVIANLIGDGCVFKSRSDYNMKYEVKDRESLERFEKDIINVYGLNPKRGVKNSGITGKPIEFVRLRSKIVFYDLLNYATYYSKDWVLKPVLLKSSKKIKREFLKAFFDDEGSIFKTKNCKPILRLYSINKDGLLQIEKILFEFGITGKIVPGFGLKRNVYAFTIFDLKLFYKKIGFNLERKQNKLKAFKSG